MASGGHFPPPQNARTPTSNSASNNRNRIDNECENENQGPPWLLTANNLSLHTSAAENRLSKKQRNKNKTKAIPISDTSPSTESSPQAAGHKATQKLSQPSKLTLYHKKDAEIGDNSRYAKMPSDLDQDGTESDISGAEAPRDLRYSVNQRRQRKNIQNGVTSKKSIENLPSSCNKQDNTNKLPDTSALVERLMHLRDCIKQVSTIMQNLEKADGPATRGQLGNLDQMLDQLKAEEHEQLELLQQVLTAREGAAAAQAASSHRNETAALDSSSSTMEDETQPVVTLPQNDNDNEEEDEETGEAIEKRNELLQKMVESQKKLVALKEQQTALLNMQKKAESRLAEVKAFHEHLLEAGQDNENEDCNGVASLNQNSHHMNGEVNRSRNPSAPMLRAANGTPEWDLAVNHNVPQASKGGNSKLARKEIKKSSSGGSVNKSLSSINTGEIQQLHNRLRALQEFATGRPNKDEFGVSPAEEQSVELTDFHRKKLENKLRELQEKKNQMDSLLAELSMHVSSTQVNGVPEETNQAVGQNVNVEFSPETDNALAEARQFLEAVNSGEKNRQMDDLKKKLKQLKLLTENIESGALEEDSQTQGDPAQWRGRYPGNRRERSQGPSLKSDNLRRDHTAPGFPARRHYEAEGRANEDGDNTQAAVANPVAAAAAFSPLTPLTAAQEESILEEHAEIEAKVEKLLVARNKLQKLQSLLGAVNQFRESGEPLPNDIMQFISNLQPTLEGFNDLSPADGNRNVTDDGTRRNVPNQGDMSRLNDVEDQLLRQQRELEQLTEERKRLLTMQEQLQVLQQHQFAAAAVGKNNEQRSSGEGGSVTRKDRNSSNLLAAGPAGDALKVRITREDNLQRNRARSVDNTCATKDTNSKAPNPVNVSKNQPLKYAPQSDHVDGRSLADLHDELSHSLALRDELQHQKVVLQELLRQEQSKQMGFSQNQDMRSQSGSSEKSELVEGSSSVMAPDTTVAATWGGSSTQDNLDDEVEEEPLESLEEQDEDEGSATELKQADGRIQELLNPFVDEPNMPDSETFQRRRNIRQCRVHGYKRGLLNQWRKNFQPPSNKKSDQVPRQENVQPEAPLRDESLEPLLNQDGRRQQFTKFFQQQLDQTNHLCQSVLKDQQALSGMLLSCSVSNQPIVPGQNAMPEMLRFYSQQFQQQQQLLLSLSHCHHLLYVQQMEILQLLQYVQQQQSSESEGAVPHPPPVTANDDFNFRPWCMTPWFNPTPNLQTPFMAPLTPFCFNSVHPSAPSFPLNSGSSPQVTPTAAQDERGATETLNNQVPPGTRANNFVDNFRSYSRQNLLSGATTSVPSKSNEHLSTISAPNSTGSSRMRPSYTFCATSEVSSSRAPRVRDPPPPFTASYSLPSLPGSGRRSSTPSASPQTNNSGARPRTKRPNLNQEQASSRRTPASLNLLDLGEHSRQNSLNSYSNPDFHVQTNLATLDVPAVVPRTSEVEPPPQPQDLESLRDSIYMEVTSLISNYEQRPEMLADLLKQLQSLGSSASNSQAWKASLTTIKEFMQLHQGVDHNNISSGVRRKGDMRNKVQTAPHNLLTLSEFARARLPTGDSQLNTPSVPHSNVFGRDNLENAAVRLAEQATVNEVGLLSPMEESSSSSSSWPKNTTTGAVQKKYSRHLTSSGTHSFNATESSQDVSTLDHQVKQAVLNLVPFLQNHLMEECTPQLQAQLCNQILNALQSLPVHQPSLRFFRSQLLQAMQQMLAKYLGKRVRDCEEDMLMEMTEVVIKELAVHKIMQRKKEDGHRSDWPSLDNNTLSNRNENANHFISEVSRLDFESPQSNEGRFLGSEVFSENEMYNIEAKNALNDHRKEWGEANFVKEDGNIHGQASESSVESSSQRSHVDLQPDRLDVRAAPDGIAAAPRPSAMVLPLSPRLLEEESGYDCDAEGETEPEVEAENDDTKNLAEADQSAGQLGSMNDRLPQSLRDGAIGAVSLSPHPRITNAPTSHAGASEERHDGHLLNGDIVHMEDLGVAGAEALSQGQTSAAEGEELSLDDIPTKLETLTPDELRRQMVEEQASNSIVQDIISDGHGNGIAGDKDNAKDPGAL